ncbi:hypothetical protein OY671_009064, partial [Metschnikowia pulcherrima]
RKIETWVAAGRDRPEKIRQEKESDVIAPNYSDNELGVRIVDGFLVVRASVFGLGNPAVVETPFTQWRKRREAYRDAAWAKTGADVLAAVLFEPGGAQRVALLRCTVFACPRALSGPGIVGRADYAGSSIVQRSGGASRRCEAPQGDQRDQTSA